MIFSGWGNTSVVVDASNGKIVATIKNGMPSLKFGRSSHG
jgi:hypothetical protein